MDTQTKKKESPEGAKQFPTYPEIAQFSSKTD
jgi:hypothetical protein